MEKKNICVDWQKLHRRLVLRMNVYTYTALVLMFFTSLQLAMFTASITTNQTFEIQRHSIALAQHKKYNTEKSEKCKQ